MRAAVYKGNKKFIIEERSEKKSLQVTKFD